MSISGKKLLILGANPETGVLIETAKSLGVFTIVTDNNPKAPVKRIADKSADVDGFDLDGLITLAKEEKVDGVLVGVADPLISTYQKLCGSLNLPCYANAEQVDVFTNKNNFKGLCKKYGIDGIPEYDLQPYLKNGDFSGIEFPVIIKPADGNSGNGISLCNSADELPAAIKKARTCSRKGIILAEKYMDCADLSIYYTFKDGEYFLSSISDRYTTKEQGLLSPVCLGDVFPSKYAGEFLINYHPRFSKMFKDLGCKNGILYISAFYKNGRLFVYDPGFRLQGGGFHLIINSASGFDHRKMLINLALTGSMGEEDLHTKNDPLFKGKSAAVLWFLLKSGKIGRIDGMDYIANHPDVVHIVKRFNEGDTVETDFIGTEKQVFARIYIVSHTKEGLRRAINELSGQIKVYDKGGNNLLLPTLNTDNGKLLLLKGKTIVISGGTKGVGKALALECARHGANVVIGGRDEKSADNIISQISALGGKAVFSYSNLQNLSHISTLFESAVKTFGQVDGYVNYAGITPIASLTDCDEATFDNVFDVNLKAAFFAAQNAIINMRKTGGGSIIFVSSAHAKSGHKDRAPYAVSKGALVTLSEHIAHNYASEQIRSNIITVGWTPTEGELLLRKRQGITEEELRKLAEKTIPMGRILENHDPIPAFIYYLSDLSAMVTGSDIRVTGGEYIN